jgi:hypothetical protein
MAKSRIKLAIPRFRHRARFSDLRFLNGTCIIGITTVEKTTKNHGLQYVIAGYYFLSKEDSKIMEYLFRFTHNLEKDKGVLVGRHED